MLRSWFPGQRVTVRSVFLISLAAAILLGNLTRLELFTALFSILATISGTLLVFRFLRRMIGRTIWRLRDRLLVTYLFIGIVPLFLVLVLVGIAGYIFAGQTAMYLVSSEFDRTLFALSVPARVLSLGPNKDAPLQAVFEQIAPFVRQRFPEFEAVVRKQGRILHYPESSTLEPPDHDAPDYTGLTIIEGKYYGWSHIHLPDCVVDVVAPVEREMLAELVPSLGKINIGRLTGAGARLQRRKVTAGSLRAAETDSVPAPANQFDYEVVSFSPVPVVEWGTARRINAVHYLFVTTRPSALLGALFGEKYKTAQGLLFAFAVISVLFLLVELGSAFIGVSLTRTITGAMESLYEGTRRIGAGDFGHRIQVKGKDQLAAVSESFNSMSERLEKLIVVEKEKERLQSELEIAREVQSQLFPRTAPKMRTLEITGLCRPARMVSGDYYDFLCLQDNNLAIAIGDVAGKGISAALLMASIQSIMRTQLSAAVPVHTVASGGETHHIYSTSTLVSRLNRQLYANTAPEKYATFLFGVYDEADHSFTYTNAGHLPPVLLRRGSATLLEVTGTVVGAFPLSQYEEQRLILEPGDVLVGYTDGITEPENEYGEEFGVERLVETLLKYQKLELPELVSRVMDAVCNWTSAEEMPDDMTLVLARRSG